MHRIIDKRVIEEKVEKGELDIGIVCSFPKEKYSYNMFQYVKSPLMVGVNIHNPLSKKEKINYSELRNENFILFH